MRLLAISGSLRRDSHNTTLLRAAASLLPSGVELAIYERLGELPPFNEELVADRPAAAQHLWDEIAAADGVLISTPEYNSSIPGVLKNALDWMSQPLMESPLRNKPAAVIGASTGMFGAVWSQAETRKVLGAIGARVVDRELPIPTAHEQFDEHGRLSDEDLEAELLISLNELIEAVNARAQALERLRRDRPGAGLTAGAGGHPERRVHSPTRRTRSTSCRSSDSRASAATRCVTAAGSWPPPARLSRRTAPRACR